jgi:SAM-dependent methyltransferase
LLVCLRLTGGESIFEIGCGTGAVMLAQAVGEQGRVVAVDIAEPMLGVARQRVGESGMRNITLLLGDAQAMRLERSAFDVVTSRMVSCFSLLCGGVPQHRQPLKPGGCHVFVCLAPLKENSHWLISYDIALHHLGAMASADAKSGPLAFADPTTSDAFSLRLASQRLQLSERTRRSSATRQRKRRARH